VCPYFRAIVGTPIGHPGTCALSSDRVCTGHRGRRRPSHASDEVLAADHPASPKSVGEPDETLAGAMSL
jgi:hypothetical protein